MRLAYLDPHPVPDDCPEAMQILQTVDGFGEVGVHVSLVTPQPATTADAAQVLGRPLHENVTSHAMPDWHRRVPLLKRSTFFFHRQAAHWLAHHPVDAILVRNLKLAAALLDIPRLPPLFFETHEVFAQTFADEHPHPNARQRKKLADLRTREALVYGKSRGLIGLTPMLLDDIRAVYGTPAPGLVAPDGVDMALADEARRPVETRARPRLLYLGSLHPWKGVDTAIEAMREVTEADLWIAGGSAARITEMRERCTHLGVGSRVRFLGHVPPRERFKLIDEVDVCLLPLNDCSIGARYTSPLKLFEYMAMGKAIVASDLPSIRCVLAPETQALLVPPESPAALAVAIRRLAADEALRARLAAAALEASRAYSWTARCAAMRDFMAVNLGGTAA